MALGLLLLDCSNSRFTNLFLQLQLTCFQNSVWQGIEIGLTVSSFLESVDVPAIATTQYRTYNGLTNQRNGKCKIVL